MNTADIPADDLELAIELGYPIVLKLKCMMAAKPPAVIDVENRRQVPTVRGQLGELHVEKILAEKFGRVEHYSVTNTATTRAAGDMTLYACHHKIIVEVKNYTNAVPSTSIEKFQRDLTASGAAGGLFISLTTPIAGVTSDFAIRHERGSTRAIPCAYIVSDSPAVIGVAAQIISGLIRTAAASAVDGDAAAVYNVTARLADLARIRNDLHSALGDINAQINKITASMVAAEVGMRHALDDMRADCAVETHPDVVAAIAAAMNITALAKHPASTREHLAAVLTALDSGAAWKIAPKKMTSGDITVNILVRTVEVIMPRDRIPIAASIAGLERFGKKISVSAELAVVLDDATALWLLEQLAA